MKTVITFVLCCGLALPAWGQIFSLTKEQMIEFTKHNPYGRFPDGRPKVPLSLIERVAELSVEEAWGILRGKGYMKQYADGFEILKPGRRLVGRAVTAQYLPHRPDLMPEVCCDTPLLAVANLASPKILGAPSQRDGDALVL